MTTTQSTQSASSYDTSRVVCQARALSILARIASGETVSQAERDAHNDLCAQPHMN